MEHIKTAKPVASKELCHGFDLKVGPATVRNEMLCLDELGYLEQPYTSAGRVPTDRGYRFFVDNLITEYSLNRAEQDLLDEVFGVKKEDEFARELSKIVSRVSSSFSAVGLLDEDIFFESGFSEILGEPEFQEVKYLKSFGAMVDALDEEIRRFWEECGGVEKEVEIFIGEENPLQKVRDYSMFFSPWKHARGFRGFLAIITPKRTNYFKHKAVIKKIKNGPVRGRDRGAKD